MTFDDFEQRVRAGAVVVDDRNSRYVSSPREHDFEMATAWPLVLLKFGVVGPLFTRYDSPIKFCTCGPYFVCALCRPQMRETFTRVPGRQL